MAQLDVTGHLQLGAIRVTRLDDGCQYVVGADNSVTTGAGILWNAEPEYEEGTEIIQKNGLGQVCVNIKNADELKRVNLTLEVCVRDIDFLNILTCQPGLLNDEGDTIGTYRVIGAESCPGAFLELWTKKATSTGSCSTTGDSWVRYVYPKVTLRTGAIALGEELSNLSLEGFAEANPNALDGPFSDLPIDGDLPGDSPEIWFSDPAGPPVTADGYGTAVPADANTATP